MMEFFDEEL
jgi:hypothetical protein